VGGFAWQTDVTRAAGKDVGVVAVVVGCACDWCRKKWRDEQRGLRVDSRDVVMTVLMY
jgi:hypothetical protein